MNDEQSNWRYAGKAFGCQLQQRLVGLLYVRRRVKLMEELIHEALPYLAFFISVYALIRTF